MEPIWHLPPYHRTRISSALEDERRQITLRWRMSLTSAAEQPSHSP